LRPGTELGFVKVPYSPAYGRSYSLAQSVGWAGDSPTEAGYPDIFEKG